MFCCLRYVLCDVRCALGVVYLFFIMLFVFAIMFGGSVLCVLCGVLLFFAFFCISFILTVFYLFYFLSFCISFSFVFRIHVFVAFIMFSVLCLCCMCFVFSLFFVFYCCVIPLICHYTIPPTLPCVFIT